MTVPLRRVFTEKRALVLPLIVGIVGNALAYALVVYPLQLRVDTLQARAEAGERAVTQALRQLEGAKATSSGKAQAVEDLQRFYTQILPTDQTGARRITYLRLAELAQVARLRYERRSVEPRQDKDSSLARLDMTMVLDGSYPDVRRFIHELETAPEFVVIRNVQLTQQRDQAGPLLLTLDLATYFRSPNGS